MKKLTQMRIAAINGCLTEADQSSLSKFMHPTEKDLKQHAGGEDMGAGFKSHIDSCTKCQNTVATYKQDKE